MPPPTNETQAGTDLIHPQYPSMMQLFIGLHSIQSWNNPDHPMTEDMTRAINVGETFVNLQVFRVLRSEIKKGGDIESEVAAFHAVRREMVVGQCDETIRIMHQVVTEREKVDSFVEALAKDKNIIVEEAKDVDNKVEGFGEGGREKSEREKEKIRRRFQERKVKMMQDADKKF